jgi:Tol biopolymer transport system component
MAAAWTSGLTTSDNIQSPSTVTADGTQLIFHEGRATTGRDLMLLSLGGADSPARSRGGKPREPPSVLPLLRTRFNEQNGDRSMDGLWLAYESDSSGSWEIYVRPFGDVAAGQWQVSTAGGIQPVWARNGKELFYLAPDGSVMSVAVSASGGVWRADTPVKLFHGTYYTRTAAPPRMYDVSADGQRFLMLKPVADTDQVAGAPRLVVVQNFAEELKRRVPVN